MKYNNIHVKMKKKMIKEKNTGEMIILIMKKFSKIKKMEYEVKLRISNMKNKTRIINLGTKK